MPPCMSCTEESHHFCLVSFNFLIKKIAQSCTALIACKFNSNLYIEKTDFTLKKEKTHHLHTTKDWYVLHFAR